ncbi:ricin-type beta-trefoil lectin domain protein [Ceratobasidium sp. AG-Ba]|nr:ricin-type beta-trefoil lectin domain protein [Ceratobasidium sp. AG-Ba]
MTNIDPPAYHIGYDSEETTPSGFPPGYFMIKNCANDRLLDITTSASADGTHAVLWPQKESSTVISMRDPAADNQVFFVDYSGALCSKASGHALDVEGGRLVLRHRKPFSLPFPNSESHPLPRITYSPSSKLLRVTFTCDPNYPAPEATDPNYTWRSRDYVVAAVPVRKPRSFLENTMAMMSTLGASFSKPHGLLGHAPTSPTASAFGHSSEAADFALREDEVLEEDRLEGEDDTDDNPEPGRPIRVLDLPSDWAEKSGSKLSDATLRRRQW